MGVPLELRVIIPYVLNLVASLVVKTVFQNGFDMIENRTTTLSAKQTENGITGN